MNKMYSLLRNLDSAVDSGYYGKLGSIVLTKQTNKKETNKNK